MFKRQPEDIDQLCAASILLLVDKRHPPFDKILHASTACPRSHPTPHQLVSFFLGCVLQLMLQPLTQLLSAR
jgi:hypothetical protein